MQSCKILQNLTKISVTHFYNYNQNTNLSHVIKRSLNKKSRDEKYGSPTNLQRAILIMSFLSFEKNAIFTVVS